MQPSAGVLVADETDLCNSSPEKTPQWSQLKMLILNLNFGAVGNNSSRNRVSLSCDILGLPYVQLFPGTPFLIPLGLCPEGILENVESPTNANFILNLAGENCKFISLQQNCQGEQILNFIKLLLMPNETEPIRQGRVEFCGYG